ncbi:MAG: hypothetical protein V4850_25795 [Myxococcota bacterium]
MPVDLGSNSATVRARSKGLNVRWMYVLTLLGACKSDNSHSLSDLGVRVVSAHRVAGMERQAPGQFHYLVDFWIRSPGEEAWLIIACGAGAPSLMNTSGSPVVDLPRATATVVFLKHPSGYISAEVSGVEPTSCAHIFPLRRSGELVLSQLEVVTDSAHDMAVCVGSDLSLIPPTFRTDPGPLAQAISRMQRSWSGLPQVINLRTNHPPSEGSEFLAEIRLGSPTCSRIPVE